jgi:hypothetical protein
MRRSRLKNIQCGLASQNKCFWTVFSGGVHNTPIIEPMVPAKADSKNYPYVAQHSMILQLKR